MITENLLNEELSMRQHVSGKATFQQSSYGSKMHYIGGKLDAKDEITTETEDVDAYDNQAGKWLTRIIPAKWLRRSFRSMIGCKNWEKSKVSEEFQSKLLMYTQSTSR